MRCFLAPSSSAELLLDPFGPYLVPLDDAPLVICCRISYSMASPINPSLSYGWSLHHRYLAVEGRLYILTAQNSWSSPKRSILPIGRIPASLPSTASNWWETLEKTPCSCTLIQDGYIQLPYPLFEHMKTKCDEKPNISRRKTMQQYYSRWTEV